MFLNITLPFRYRQKRSNGKREQRDLLATMDEKESVTEYFKSDFTIGIVSLRLPIDEIQHVANLLPMKILP